MLLEVEVSAGENSPLDLHRMFDLLSDPVTVGRVMATDPLGRDLWCDVTGWGPQRAVSRHGGPFRRLRRRSGLTRLRRRGGDQAEGGRLRG